MGLFGGKRKVNHGMVLIETRIEAGAGRYRTVRYMQDGCLVHEHDGRTVLIDPRTVNAINDHTAPHKRWCETGADLWHATLTPHGRKCLTWVHDHPSRYESVTNFMSVTLWSLLRTDEPQRLAQPEAPSSPATPTHLEKSMYEYLLQRRESAKKYRAMCGTLQALIARYEETYLPKYTAWNIPGAKIEWRVSLQGNPNVVLFNGPDAERSAKWYADMMNRSSK